MAAASVAVPQTWETFLFVHPTAWPLSSGAPISLDVCNGNWDRSGFLVRVDHNVKTWPKKKKVDQTTSWYVGGPDARVFVSGPLKGNTETYKPNEPIEWTFDVLKIVSGSAASPGTPINSGDRVMLRINSNFGQTFFFRVTGRQSGAEVHGDGTALGQAGVGTVFTVEFNEARSGLGWRPSVIKCQSCAVVTAKVTRVGTVPPKNIDNADVVANVQNYPFSGTTGIDGRTTLVAFVDGANRNCIPPGNVNLEAKANRHQKKTVNVSVPDTGSIEVPIQLDCTQVKGKVIDSNGNAVPGVTVYLRDQNRNIIRDENDIPYQTTTAADGSFVFNCVAHEYVQVWTTVDPSQTQHTRDVEHEGWTNVTIVLQTTCGNLVGKVTDRETGQPIADATVTESGGRQTTTDANGCFTFICVKPAGANTVFASATGYSEDFETAIVPTTGNFDCENLPSEPVNIKLDRVAVMAFQIRMDWGTQPSDLDAHLSGPNGAGGRFHLRSSLLPALPGVAFASLDVDDTTTLGPETITIRRSPATAAGMFVAGDYHYWVHNYTATYDPSSTFAGSGAAVSVSTVDAQGNLSQIGHYDVVNATGTEDDLWHVGDLTIDANGNLVLHGVQTFQLGDQNTVL